MHCYQGRFTALLALLGATLSASAVRAQVPIRVTVENIAPTNSVATSPVRFGFGNGTFDSFDEGQAAFLLGAATIADAPIVGIAEGGSNAAWNPAFLAVEPNANIGSVVGASGNAGPPFTPGETASTVLTVDTANQYFSFGSMVVPSNDFFVGNDSPTQYQVFDGGGNLILSSITLTASDIWDAGSETEDPNNAAFLVVGVNANRVNENGTVERNFSELSTFNGLETAEGYTFDSSLLSADTGVLRISFAVVPEPATWALAASALGVVGWLRRRAR
ncbi:MAG: PEP-CTERM sorting domain-containing protein [Planctomycetaceae bacterium]|nr:PEP-CTERM sorting domain-containing protein [Planctomycetaceae bacterium]